MVDRLFVEKKPGFDNEARALLTESIVISPQRGTPTPMVYDIIRSARA